MKINKYAFLIALGLSTLGCTKLDEHLRGSLSTIGTSAGSTDVQSLLNGAYNDLLTPFISGQDQIFSLEENTSDECLVPTRGGDWDDNGVWRVLHAHAWDATHGQSITVFNDLGTMEYDATVVLSFNPTQEQAAEAKFLRAFAQFYYLDLYGQVPARTVAAIKSIDAAPVYTPAQAIDTMVANLTEIIPQMTATGPFPASADAARFLLMKVLLNKQAFLNRQTPAAADPADMQQVVALGNAIMANPLYKWNNHYFDIFGPNNGGTAPGIGFDGASTESIFVAPNNGSSSNNGINSAGIDARWMMTLHYNSNDQNNLLGSAGWNGFSTISELYNAFDDNDTRRGNVAYPGVTDAIGLKAGLLEGQQYNENGVAETDRKGNPLNFTPDVALVETDPNTLEDAGIRILKYAPDPANYNGGNQRNQFQFMRYADVVLMVAEAQLRNNDPADALTNVNLLRSKRGASPLTTLTLVNTANLYDGTTMLAERQKELYWESWRRQDLIRFGVFLQPWDLKPTDDPKFLLFPIPTTQLIANPNLKQNPGY